VTIHEHAPRIPCLLLDLTILVYIKMQFLVFTATDTSTSETLLFIEALITTTQVKDHWFNSGVRDSHTTECPCQTPSEIVAWSGTCFIMVSFMLVIY
jgi:hypothetical protein